MEIENQVAKVVLSFEERILAEVSGKILKFYLKIIDQRKGENRIIL